ncbi:hypothetical protein CSUB01_07241 [Colletotrichum sublineola]|uniref:Uncharacterized protein n=1 Tax=Colletotrichum sublineola TaxID=1173701 RepID=A0A066XT16_COLSU|nr:hypothetical protein CSUB01_07241 [Colletotrichum sublineola]
MLPHIFAFAAAASGARVQRRQADCSSTITLDTLSVTTVQPISIYILAGQLAPTGTKNNNNNNDDPFTIVYTTVYSTFCPDCAGGLQPKTYTVTQPCTGAIASCRPTGNVLPAGFITTQATCTNCPTPFSAVLTVPKETDVVVTQTFLQTVTEPGLTTTRTIVRTCASEPCLPEITGYTGSVQTIDTGNRGTLPPGLFAEPATATATVVVTATATAERTATVTVDANGKFKPVGLNSGAGRLVSSDKMLVFGMSAFALFLLSSL